MPFTSLPAPNATDIKLLDVCDSSVRVRRLLEIGVVRKLLETAAARGFTVSINDGEQLHTQKTTLKTIDQQVEVCFAVDECWVNFRRGGIAGTVFLVFGNSGWDTISDYHTSLDGDALMGPVNQYAEDLSYWAA